MHNSAMRTTIDLDEDVHEFARLYANAKGITLSKAIDELIRRAQAAPEPDTAEIKRLSNGFPVFGTSSKKISSQVVRQLEEEEL